MGKYDTLDGVVKSICSYLMYSENKLYCGSKKKCYYKIVDRNTNYCTKLKEEDKYKGGKR